MASANPLVPNIQPITSTGSFHACCPSVESCREFLQVRDDLVQLLQQNPGLDQYMPMFAAKGFTSLADVYDCPQLELDPILAKMKGPHTKLMQRLCTSLPPPRGDEWTTVVHSRGRTMQDVLTAGSLSEFVPCFGSKGYDFGGDLLAATDAELERLCASMRPVERRRLLRVVGRPVRPDGSQEQQEQQRQVVAAEWARFVSTPGRTVGSLFKAAGLSAFTQHFESEGYTVMPFLLDASMQELLAVSTLMKAVERQRLVRVIGRKWEISAEAAAAQPDRLPAGLAVHMSPAAGDSSAEPTKPTQKTAMQQIAEAAKAKLAEAKQKTEAAAEDEKTEEAEKAAAAKSLAAKKQQESVAASAAQAAAKATEEARAKTAEAEKAEAKKADTAKKQQEAAAAAVAAAQAAAAATEEARVKKAEAEKAALLEAAKKQQEAFAAQQMASKTLQVAQSMKITENEKAEAKPLEQKAGLAGLAIAKKEALAVVNLKAEVVAADKVYTSACDRFKIDMKASFDGPCETCKFVKRNHQAPEPKSKPLPKPPLTKAPATSAVRIPFPLGLRLNAMPRPGAYIVPC
jgi:hypothetical protein